MPSLIKILYISHACVVPENRKKLARLVELFPVSVQLVAPSVWIERDMKRRYVPKREAQENYPITFAAAALNWHVNLWFFRNGIRHLVNQFAPDIVHIDEEPCSLVAFQCLRAAKHLGVKTVIFSFQNLYKHYPFPFSCIERWNLTHCDYIIAGCHGAKEVLLKKGAIKPITVIPPGIAPELYYRQDCSMLAAQLGLEGFVIGFAGRLVPEKGIETLLLAFAKLSRPATLLLVGSGPYKQEAQRLAEELGISKRLRLVEGASHREVPKYLNCMDVLVLPSLTAKRWKEQFGRVLIEAMACEAPVIGSSSGEIPNVIGDAGLVFREGDVDDLSEKIQRLIDNSRIRQKLSKSGRERALMNFTWDKVAEKTFQVYQQLVHW